MSHTNDIIIRAPLNKVFAAASDIARWPEFLPHYRYNRFVSQTPSGGTVKMSCLRAGISFTWISKFNIDTVNRQLHFHHLPSALKATQGIDVVWTFEELPDGSVHVRIGHEFRVKVPVVGPVLSDWIVGEFLINHIARKTLAGLKRKVEAQSEWIKDAANKKAGRPVRRLKARKKPAPVLK